MKRTLLSFLTVLVLVAFAAWRWPGATMQPGRLPAAHAALKDRCLACHTLFQGASRDKCLACHPVAEIGLRDAAGVALTRPRPAVQGLHQRSAATACFLCHAEHAGRLGPAAAGRFSHARLPVALSDDCGACHDGAQPRDSLHALAGMSCGNCHGREAWTPATFDHGMLMGARTCGGCHRAQRPDDEPHRDVQASGDCGACHQTKSWTPASFDHGRWFLLGGPHPPHCADCHQPGVTYRSYTCTGCHAHSPDRLAAEHREEGIRDTRDCVRCHRGGGEREGDEHLGSEHEDRDD